VAIPEIRASLQLAEVEFGACSAFGQRLFGHNLGKEGRIAEAARWLKLNRSEVVGAAIPFLKVKFGLSNLEAIEATKRAHALTFPGSAP
jgi:hypothetical protein